MSAADSSDVRTNIKLETVQVLASFALPANAADWTALDSPSIKGWVLDCTDGVAYPFGTCASGYFCFDRFGWAAWPDAAGLMRGLHYSLTGEALDG